MGKALTTATIFLLLAGTLCAQPAPAVDSPTATTWTIRISVPAPSPSVVTPGEILLRFTASGEAITGERLAEAIIAKAADPKTFKGQALYRSVTLQAAERCRKVEAFEPFVVYESADWKADGEKWESTIKPTPLGVVKVSVTGLVSWWLEEPEPPEPVEPPAAASLDDLELGVKKK